MIPNTRYWFLLLLIFLVYLIGMFVPLIENDSAQFAVMAMRMVQENDFLNLFKGPEAYLDKPHLHFWLAALSFKVFGIHDWAYRIPGILALFLGAYGCYGLGSLVYNKEVGKVAALVFLTAQSIVLAAIDVRTDAVLTGFTIFAIWQLATYVERNTIVNLVWGAFGAGMAFSTKGQIALLVIGLPMLCHLAYTRRWQRLLNWRILVGLLVFILAIAPMLYAYYLQFDLHPELTIRGKNNRSGVFFIFWQQSFERLSGEGIGKNSSDYFFFFHSFLWVFLPWTVIGVAAYWDHLKIIFSSRLRNITGVEFLTFGGITLIFIIVSFAQFKLPHYLNIIIPLFAVLTASYLTRLNSSDRRKPLKAFLGIQYFILSLLFIVSSLIYFYVFDFARPHSYIWKLILLVLIVYYSLKQEEYYLKIITVSVCSAVMLNAVLNLHFYPSLLKYQGGLAMARVIKEKGVPVDKIHKLSSEHTWALDFYNQKPVIISRLSKIEGQRDIWIYANDAELNSLRSYGLDWDKQYTVNQFRITRLQAKFLDPYTRHKVLNKMHLIHLY